MSGPSLSAKCLAEVDLIRADCSVLLGLADKRKHREIFWLAMPPIMAFFAVEVLEWHTRVGLPFSADIFSAYAGHLQKTRAALKVFDGRGAGVTELEDLHGRVTDRAVLSFNKHKGILAPLKRLLQADLGLYFLGSHLVCTTHLATINMAGDRGTTDDHLDGAADRSHAFGYAFGGFIATLAARIDAKPAELPSYERKLIHYEDWKGKRFYTQLSRTIGLVDRGASLTWLVAQVNFVHRWLRDAFPAESDLLRRLRILAGFHSLSGLTKLVAGPDRSGALRQVAAGLIGSPEARALRKLRDVRNLAAHYTLDEANEAELRAPNPFQTMLARVASIPIDALDELVDSQLESVSVGLGTLLRPTRSPALL